MKQLYFYNQDGTIYFNTAYIEGYNTLGVEVPDGKQLVGIDTSKTPHEPIFKDVEKSDVEQRLDALELGMAGILGGV